MYECSMELKIAVLCTRYMCRDASGEKASLSSRFVLTHVHHMIWNHLDKASPEIRTSTIRSHPGPATS